MNAPAIPREDNSNNVRRVVDELLAGNRTGVGVYDGLSALLASKYRFDFLWVSSFATSATAGLPDIGLLDASEMEEVVGVVRRASHLPIVLDMDAGYGDAAKIEYAARRLAAMGVNGLCIEDNPTSKRCSLYDDLDRVLVSPEEHCERIAAARSGVQDFDCAVIARTESLVAGRGVDDAYERLRAYVSAGADAVFVQAVEPDPGPFFDLARRWNGRAPMFAAPTRYPFVAKTDWWQRGVSHTIYANHAIRAAHKTVDATLSRLAEADSSSVIENEISSVKALSVDLLTSELA